MDIVGNVNDIDSQRKPSKENTASKIEDIEAYVTKLESSVASQSVKTPHRSLFKFDLTVRKFHIDLFNENSDYEQPQIYSIHENEQYNPFSDLKDLKEQSSKLKNLEKTLKSFSGKSKLAIASLLVEGLSLQFNMLEEVGCEDETRKLKLDLKFNDLIAVNNLFVYGEDFTVKLNAFSEPIPLHPKLFDQSSGQEYSYRSYCLTIENVLKNHPERVVLYCQRASQESSGPSACTSLEFFMILKKTSQSTAEEFQPAERIINLYKSLERKLPFNLFVKYC